MSRKSRVPVALGPVHGVSVVLKAVAALVLAAVAVATFLLAYEPASFEYLLICSKENTTIRITQPRGAVDHHLERVRIRFIYYDAFGEEVHTKWVSHKPEHDEEGYKIAFVHCDNSNLEDCLDHPVDLVQLEHTIPILSLKAVGLPLGPLERKTRRPVSCNDTV